MSDEVSRRAREDELAAELIAKKAARDEADLIKARASFMPRAVFDASERMRRDAANTMQHSGTDYPPYRTMCRVGVSDFSLVMAWLEQHLAGLKAGRAEREE